MHGRHSAPALAAAHRRSAALPQATARVDAAMADVLWRGLPQLLAVLDSDGRLGATNPSWQRLLGLGAQQLRGQPLLAWVHADDQAAARRWLHPAIGGAGPASFSGRWRCANGGHLRLQWTLALGDGLACAIGQPAPPADQAGACVSALQARQQTLRSVARLAGGLSHEFNNLLQVMRNALELIQQRPNEARLVALWAGSALRTLERSAQLTSQLLAFAGRQRWAPQTVQLDSLLQGLRLRLQGLLTPHTVLRLDLPLGGVLVIGDTAQLEQAVLNLARNAVDAMRRGGCLAITLGRLHVEEDPELATGDYATIDVSDSGSGMSEAVRARAFEPYFTTKALGAGSGLGLSQVYGCAQQIGGSVRLQAAGAHVHTVRLLLPAAAGPVPAAAGPVAAATAPHAPLDMAALGQAIAVVAPTQP